MRSEYLSPEEIWCISQLLTTPNATAVKVLLHTGLRVGDVLTMKKSDVKRQFWITEQKTGKRRRVNLPDSLIAEIMAQTEEGNPWAFPGRKPGTHRTRQALWWDLKRAAKAFRIPANATPHSLRKSFAVNKLAKSGDLETVRRSLGHSDSFVTMIYAMADAMRENKVLSGSPPKRPR
jgi:integrase